MMELKPLVRKGYIYDLKTHARVFPKTFLIQDYMGFSVEKCFTFVFFSKNGFNNFFHFSHDCKDNGAHYSRRTDIFENSCRGIS